MGKQKGTQAITNQSTGRQKAAAGDRRVMGLIMKQIILIITSIFFLSCAALSDQSTIEKHKQEHTENLQSVKIQDGINKDEAEVLSSEYFWRHVSGCGYAGKPKDGGGYWLSIAYVGYAGIPLNDKIKINKQSGAISLKGYPTIANPLKEWKISP